MLFFIENLPFLFFSKLDLSAYLSYYILSVAFYLKNYCIFYYSLLKSSLKSRIAQGITYSIILNSCYF